MEKIINFIQSKLRPNSPPNPVNYQNISPNPKSEYFEVNNWQVSDIVIQSIIPAVGTHPFPISELNLMVGAVAYIKPLVIFEWGTNIGKSARVFYEATATLGLTTKIYSIDLPDHLEHNEHPKNDRGILVRGLPRIELIQGDGLSTSCEFKNKISAPESKILFFIDGDHSYESVLRELRGIHASYPQASLLLHDTFLQSPDSKYNVGPHLAIQEFLAEIPRNTFEIINTQTGLPGMSFLNNKRAK